MLLLARWYISAGLISNLLTFGVSVAAIYESFAYGPGLNA